MMNAHTKNSPGFVLNYINLFHGMTHALEDLINGYAFVWQLGPALMVQGLINFIGYFKLIMREIYL